VTGSTRFNLSSRIANTTQFRYLYEERNFQLNETDGFRFAVEDVPILDNLDQETLSARQFSTTTISDGYFLISDFDLYDRFFVSLLARNDGNSRFGPDERRHWYFRGAGSWLMSEESWFRLPGVEDFKLRYAVGTAGNWPRFEAQYETYSVSDGFVNPVNLGNRQLKPEFSIEHEVGIDATMLNGRMGLMLTYADTETRDQILPVPLPRYTGFGTQWQNAGTLKSRTWEASLDGVLVNRGDFFWSARVLFDHTRSRISELNRPAFNYTTVGGNNRAVFHVREGVEFGTFYGLQFARSCDHLPAGMSCDGFAVNDDGYLVWVGSGGLSSNAWGTNSGDVVVRGSQLSWGTPFAGECDDSITGERTQFCPVGKGPATWNMGFSSQLSWKGFTLYGLLDAVQDFEVYNMPLQWALFRRNIGMMDQTGVPEGQRKPIGYYDALYGVSGLVPSSEFVEDGSFVKLRELSLTYRLDGPRLAALSRSPVLGSVVRPFDGVSLRLTGRNLHTWTNYRGFDPETGASGDDTGSATLARSDGFRYPQFRTYTFGVELNF
jgi:hypothetical protein